MKSKKIIKIAFVFTFLLALVFGQELKTTLSLQMETQSWLKSWFGNLESGMTVEEVQAALTGWQSWPRSRRHKDFDGGWIMPFEIFEQRMIKHSGSGAAYIYRPLLSDINGDGLLDIIYSAAGQDPQYYHSQGRLSGEVEQYIAIQRGNGTYSIVYKCAYKNSATNPYQDWWYYGDCADMSYTSTADMYPTSYEAWWLPLFPFTDNQRNYPTHWTPGNADPDALFNGLYSAQNPVHFSTTDPQVDRYIPELMDMNGDSLPDVVFHGMQREFRSLFPTSWFDTRESYVLYNTGRGFVVGSACVNGKCYVN
jgi:hypothetical protein